MIPVVIKPSSWLTTGIRVEKINNLNLFKFTEELGERMKELLEKKKGDLLTPEEAAELEAIGELDTIFSYINAIIASQPWQFLTVSKNLYGNALISSVNTAITQNFSVHLPWQSTTSCHSLWGVRTMWII